MTLTSWHWASCTSEAAAAESTGSSTITLAPWVMHRVELLLLQRHVGVGVLVDHRAVGAELRHLGLEAREVVLLVAGRAPGRASGRPPCRWSAPARRCRRGARPRATARRSSRKVLVSMRFLRCFAGFHAPANSAGLGRRSRRFDRVRAAASGRRELLPASHAAHPPPRGEVVARAAPGSATASSPFCFRNCRLKFERLLKPDAKQASVIRSVLVVHQQLAGEVDPQPVDELHERQPGVAAEAAREGARCSGRRSARGRSR